jgi:hypothetical protein
MDHYQANQHVRGVVQNIVTLIEVSSHPAPILSSWTDFKVNGALFQILDPDLSDTPLYS